MVRWWYGEEGCGGGNGLIQNLEEDLTTTKLSPYICSAPICSLHTFCRNANCTWTEAMEIFSKRVDGGDGLMQTGNNERLVAFKRREIILQPLAARVF